MKIVSQKLASGGIRRLTAITGDVAAVAEEKAISLEKEAASCRSRVRERLRLILNSTLLVVPLLTYTLNLVCFFFFFQPLDPCRTFQFVEATPYVKMYKLDITHFFNFIHYGSKN